MPDEAVVTTLVTGTRDFLKTLKVVRVLCSSREEADAVRAQLTAAELERVDLDYWPHEMPT